MKPIDFALVTLLCSMTFAQPKEFQAPNPDIAAVAEGNNAFAFDLYAQLAAKDGNLFFSPYSINSALAMTYAGAKGDTARQMAAILHYQLDNSRLHPALNNLMASFNAPPTFGEKPFELIVANALWGQKGYPFHKGFVDLVHNSYSAGFNEVDFIRSTEEARVAINQWVEKQTNEKIKDLLAKGVLTPDNRLVLTNAIYFKSSWDEQFNPQNTKDADFATAGGKTVKAKMMNQQRRFNYGETDDAQLLELPYRDGALSMVVILPKKGDGLRTIEKSLTAGSFDATVKGLQQRPVIVSLPKFKMTQEARLSETLTKIGMGLAFDMTKADFSGIVTVEPLFIGEVIHKAFVDVNEEGTEAAAATAVVMVAGSAPPRPQEPVVFKADHPFVFAIRHRQTGVVLFMGRENDPSAGE